MGRHTGRRMPRSRVIVVASCVAIVVGAAPTAFAFGITPTRVQRGAGTALGVQGVQAQSRGLGVQAVQAAPAATIEIPRTIAIASRRLNVRVGHQAQLLGRVSPARAGWPVVLEGLVGRRWLALAHGWTGPRGGFDLRMRVGRPCSLAVRVRIGGLHRGVGRLNAFRLTFASWYGPGLYGSPLACGGRLSAYTLGVANRTLPCGTWVTLRLGRRMLRVQVVDRGPYVYGRDWDLTGATRAALGFGDTGALLATA